MAKLQLGVLPTRPGDSLDTRGPALPVPVILRSASFTLGSAVVNGTAVEVDTAATVTVPLDSTYTYALGTVIEIMQIGTGQVVIVGESGVVLRTAGTLATRSQWSALSLRKRAANEWVVSGDST